MFLFAGAVDLLQAVEIGEGKDGVTMTQGFCPKRAARDGGSVEGGFADLAYQIDEDAQLRVDLQKAFKGKCCSLLIPANCIA